MRQTRLIGLIDDYAIMCVPLEEMCPIEQHIAAERWNNLPYADRMALRRYRAWREKRAASQNKPERLPDLTQAVDPSPWLTGTDQGFLGAEGVPRHQPRSVLGLLAIVVMALLSCLGR